MKELIVTGNEQFIIVTDHDDARAKEFGCSQFAIGPLEDTVVRGVKLSRLDQAGMWLRDFHSGKYGPNYRALLVVGAVAKRMFPDAIKYLAEQMQKAEDQGNALDQEKES